MTRKYFIKARLLDKPPKPPKSPPKPKLPKQHYVIVKMKDGTVRWMNSAWVRKRRGQQAGAEAIQRLGLAHRWNSESARKAALKVWRTRWRLSKRTGRRIGRRVKNMAKVNRQELRARYAATPEKGIQYHPALVDWNPGGSETPHTVISAYWTLSTGPYMRVISERAALVRLGHLRPQHGFVPEEWTDGTVPALPVSGGDET